MDRNDATDRKDALRDAFLSPTLYRDIVDTYRDTGSVPRDLEAALVHRHGITDTAKGNAARVFMSSAQFASVLAADGLFLEEFTNRGRSLVTAAPTRGSAVVRSGSAETEQAQHTASEERCMTIPMVLSGHRVAKLVVPVKLTESDLAVLRKQIDALEEQVGANTPPRTIAFTPRHHQK